MNDTAGSGVVRQRTGAFLGWWTGGVIIFSAVMLLLAFSWINLPDSVESRTVGEAMSAMQTDKTVDSDTTAQLYGEGKQSGYRLQELAQALGLPEGSLPENVLELGASYTDPRRVFVAMMTKAVERGDLTPAEAIAVVKAYDAGLVDIPVRILNSEIAGAAAKEAADSGAALR